jgi:hypothetical protein
MYFSYSILPKTSRSHLITPLSWDQLIGKEQVTAGDVPCTCGVFLESQTESRRTALKIGEQPNSIYSFPIGTLLEEVIPGGIIGKKMCTKKCVEEVIF